MDPLADKFPSVNSYVGMDDNPVMFVDMDGDKGVIFWRSGPKDWYIGDANNAYDNDGLYFPGNSFEQAALYNSSIFNAREYGSIYLKHAWYNWANDYSVAKGLNTQWFNTSALITSLTQVGMLDINPSFLNNTVLGSLVLSKETNDFLYNVANSVQQFNMKLVNEISNNSTLNGSKGSFENDLDLLRIEQMIVQKEINKLGSNKSKIINDYNKAFGIIKKRNPYSEYLRTAEKVIGEELDFGNYEHRIAIGVTALRLQYGLDTSIQSIQSDIEYINGDDNE